MPEPVPIESFDGRELFEEKQELAFDQIVMAEVVTSPIWEDQVTPTLRIEISTSRFSASRQAGLTVAPFECLPCS